MGERVPCPDCGDDPDDFTMHTPNCPRVSSCGQCGPPWPDPPFHKFPAQISRDEYLGDLTEHRAKAHRDPAPIA